MKKLIFVAALALSVAVLAGCNCSKYNRYDNTVTTVRYNPNPICPPPPSPCPPQIACTPAPQPMPQPVMVPQQPACPLPNNACYSVPPLPQPAVVSSVLPPQQAFTPGRITFAEPVQVSGANSVQYYNPYAVPRF